MATEITVQQPAALEPVRTATQSIIQMAVQQGASIEILERLMALKEREEANEARRAFNEAKAAFKKNPPTILKNKQVNQGQGRPQYRHATLDECVGKIVPALAAVGLEHSWIPSRGPNGEIVVTCRLSGFGHFEDFTMSAPPDAGPGRNAIQAIASTTTYLERYTLLAATGLAAADQDDDARSAEPQGGSMDEGAVNDFLASIEGSGTVDELQQNYFKARDAAEAAHDKNATREFAEAKNNRWRKLIGGRK